MSKTFIVRLSDGGNISVRQAGCKCNANFRQDVNEGYMEYVGMTSCSEHLSTAFWRPIFLLNVAFIRSIAGRIVNDPVSMEERQ